MDSILEVNGLVKRYPAFFLDNISFSLPEGCVLGFIGANGAGKTTTIRSILNLAHKDAGTIKIFGLDTVKHEQEIKDRAVHAGHEKHHCACLFQMERRRLSVIYGKVRA